MCGACPPSAVVHSIIYQTDGRSEYDRMRLFMVAAYSAAHLLAPATHTRNRVGAINPTLALLVTMVAAARGLVVLLAVCGLCPLSALSEGIPPWLDVCNALFRIAIALAYTILHIMEPSAVTDLQGKTFQVSLMCVRFLLVVNQIVVLPMLPAFGQCVPKIIHLRLRSALVLVPFVLYVCVILSFGFLLQNPFQSWSRVALLFPYVSLVGGMTMATLQTVILINFKQQLQRINSELENAPNCALVELEFVLAKTAKKRVKLNKLMADTESTLGPMMAPTIFALCLRLSFTTFANFFAAMTLQSSSLSSLTHVFTISLRTILKIVVMVQLAYYGQQLVEEDSISKDHLDGIITQRHKLPAAIVYQVGKCRQVFNKGKTGTNAWSFFNLDHSLLITIVNIMFSLVSIQIQFYVSETMSTSN